jgi:hypothetical protein
LKKTGFKTLKVGVDIGGTHVRVGLVQTLSRGKPPRLKDFKTNKIESSPGRWPDIHRVVETAAALIRGMTDRWEKRGWSVIRQVGVSAPGAYLKNGKVYPGTVPNIPGLEKVKLFSLFLQSLGSGWTITASHVNNDGVLQGLFLADRYAAAKSLKEAKIIVLVPGTGFGAGAYVVKEGVVRPMPGPQQLFDVVVREAEPGEPMVIPDGTVRLAKGREPLIAENLMTGQALRRLGTYLLGKEVTGEQISRWALSPGTNRNHKRAKDIFFQVGRDLARFINRTQSGKFKKQCVPHRPDTRGAAHFLIGGSWLVQGAGRKISLPQAIKILRGSGLCSVQVIPADKIPGFGKRFLWKGLGVLGASLLVD